VDLIYETDDEFDVLVNRIRPLLNRYEQQLLNARFNAMGLSTKATRAVTVNEVNLTSDKAQMAQRIGGFLPYIFLLFCFMGAMYPALDMGAGEKERGTLETLLTAPVGRYQFLVGKTLTITLAGLFAAIVSILSIMGSVWFIEDIPERMLETAMSILSPTVVGVLLSLLVPLTIFFAAAQLSLSFYAKSYKEAQSTVSPLLIAVLVPAVAGILPGISLNTTTALIPVLNVALATKDALAGTLGLGHLALVYGSLLTLAAASLGGCMYVIRSERVLFRT
jgi:sodium transport system permease protein